MLIHKNTIISQDVINEAFVCDLSRCKGICCVEGEYGAPLENDEIPVIQNDLENIIPFMDKAAVNEVEKRGFYEVDPDGEKVTNCIDKKACVFAVKENDGIYKCAIEQAHNNGKSRLKKPVSCHLYPVRLSKVGDNTAVNYDRWEICSPACELGSSLKVPVYRFVKDALIRKFGENWFKELESIIKEYKQS